jgi:tRNA (adenine57-N1/adenine58-N1)-methyltransferase
MIFRPGGRLQAGESVLFVDRKDRAYLKRLRPGTMLALRGGRLEADRVIGLPEGSRVRNSVEETFLVLRPTYAELVLHLPRRAQVIYPKDTGFILLWGDVFPGATVVEAGTGPGALTIALLRAVGPEGRVVSYELREDFAEMARENVSRFFGDAPNWTLHSGRDVCAGIAEREVDRLILDLPEPWRALDAVASALRPGGVFVGYVPTVLQVKALVEGLERHGAFARIETLENLVRHWHVSGLSVRPEHRMVAHTGFLVVARRLAEP